MPDLLAHHWAWAVRDGLHGVNAWAGVCRHYVLEHDGKTPRLCGAGEIEKWISWYQTADRTLAIYQRNEVVVSTIFTGYDLQAADRRNAGGPAILWETLVCGGSLDGKCQRYHTYTDAEMGHAAMCLQVNQGKWKDVEKPQAPVIWERPEQPVIDEAEPRRKPRKLNWNHQA